MIIYTNHNDLKVLSNWQIPIFIFKIQGYPANKHRMLKLIKLHKNNYNTNNYKKK